MKYESHFNASRVGFFIQGFSGDSKLRFSVFLISLCVYFSILLGNLMIFVIILANSRLHIPMYIFLMNLSTVDIIYASNILPNLMTIMVTKNNAVTLTGCMTQMFFYMALTCSEVLLLEAMAYDRYLAICHPLQYLLLMSMRHCAGFAAASWILSFLLSIGITILTSKQYFCGSHRIDHFYCDIAPILKLSCSSTFIVEVLNYIVGVLVTFNAFVCIIISYLFIISAILKIKSSEGRHKAFSTCSSHLTSVIVFYGTLFILYMRPSSSYSPEREKYFSFLSGVLIPILNPIIYSLKNQEFKIGFMNIKKKLQQFLKIST